MKTTIYFTILFTILFFTGCSTVKKTVASVAIPFAAIGDTAVVPFQLIGDCSTPLMNMGDDHYMKTYEENKLKTTEVLATSTSYVFYFPGYLCMLFDFCTPDKYYPMTKACLKTISPAKEKNSKKRIRRSPYRKTPPKEEFKEW